MQPTSDKGDESWDADAGRDGVRTGPPRGIDVRWGELLPSDHLPTLTDPFSQVTEQFRMLRVKLDSSEARDGGSPHVLAFTSAVPGEGKTCTALNTAIAAGQEVERRVVLVECDLRRRRIGDLLENPPSIGLTQYLQGKADLGDVLLKLDRPPGLSVILAGRAPTNPAELLGSRAMKGLVEELQRSFDLVLLDTPPGLNFADASRLGPLVDGYVVVVRSGYAPRDGVAKLYHSLEPFGITGVVLNDVKETAGTDYGYYYRQYSAANAAAAEDEQD